MPKPTVSTEPRRYGDVVPSAAGGAAVGGSTVPGAATGAAASTMTTNAPAGAVRDGGAVRSTSFSTDAREDDPGDRDRARRKPATKDLISRRLEMDGYFSTSDRFDWCRDVYQHRMAFSRRYGECDVLVDLFGNDNAGVREEIARKRAAIIAHNAEAKFAVERLMETCKNDEAFEAGMAFLRQKGAVPFGYIPMVGLPLDIDLTALKSGAVLDLPPPARGADPAEVGAQIGVGVR